MIFYRRVCIFIVLITISSIMIADSLINVDTTINCDNISQNLWQPRAFSSYKTREIILLQDKTKQPYTKWASTLSFAIEYMQSFGSSECRLGGMPFWSGTNSMTIGTNDGASNLDAYQFGLGDVIKQGTITLQPEVQHVGGEWMFNLLQRTNDTGFYCHLKVPVGAMIMKHSVIEDLAIIEQKEIIWEPYTVLSKRHKSITDALIGGCEEKEPDFKYGRLAKDRLTKVRCGDIESAVGYNVFTNLKGHFGIAFKCSVPTGNVPTAEYMLEPIFGRAGHWGVGAEFQGCWHVREDERVEVDLQCRGDVLHLTDGRAPNWRSFDLALNGKGSKYMLLQRYDTKVHVGQLPTGPTTIDIIAGPIQPAINLTTLPVRSRIGIEGSFAVMLDCKRDHWNVSITGECWGRSGEHLEIDTCRMAQFTDKLHLNDWAVLGRQVNRDDRFDHNMNNVNANVFLCEPLAKINAAEDRVYAQPTPSQIEENIKVNNKPPGGAAISPTGSKPGVSMGAMVSVNTYDTTKVKDARIAAHRIPEDPREALDVVGAQAARVFTGKVTGELGYTWKYRKHVPHLSLFGGIEFADKTSRFVNYWSIGVQGSAQF